MCLAACCDILRTHKHGLEFTSAGLICPIVARRDATEFAECGGISLGRKLISRDKNREPFLERCRDLPANAIVNRLMETVWYFMGNAGQSDDITLLIIKRVG